MKVKEVDDFQILKDDWNNLLKRNVLGDNVFLTWEWLSAWWRRFGEGRKLLLLVVEDQGEVIAIAPLMLSKYKLPALGTIKKVEFIGVKHADYNNFIILRNERDCLKLIANYLVDVADWDWIELKEIPETEENLNYLQNLFSGAPSNLKLSKRICNICPYIPLPESFDILLKKLSKNMRQNLNKYLRRIKAHYKVEFKRYDEAGLNVDEAMRIFINLHETRWGTEESHGAFGSNPDFQDFHMKVARIFAEKDWLGLYFLTANDEPISAQYTFEYEEKIYYYLGGFDPNYAQYSVGNLTIMFLLERGIKKGFKEYDMMRGNEYYKRLWTNKYRRNLEFRITRENLRCKFYSWLTWSGLIERLADKMKLSLKQKPLA